MEDLGVTDDVILSVNSTSESSEELIRGTIIRTAGAVLLIVSVVIGVPTNTIILISNRRRTGADVERPTSSAAFQGFTVASLLISGLYAPGTTVVLLRPDLSYDVLRVLCPVLLLLQGYKMFCYLLNFLCISANVYLHVAYPLRAISVLSSPWIKKTYILVVWVFPLLPPITFVSWFWTTVDRTGVMDWECRIAPRTATVAFAVTHAVFVFGFLFPSVILAFALQFRVLWLAKKKATEIEIQRSLRSQERETNAQGNSTSACRTVEEDRNYDNDRHVGHHASSSPNDGVPQTAQSVPRRRWKGEKWTFMVVLLLLTVWFPAILVIGIYAVCPDCVDDAFAMTILYLAYAKGAMAPLQFTLACKQQKKRVRAVLSQLVSPFKCAGSVV